MLFYLIPLEYGHQLFAPLTLITLTIGGVLFNSSKRVRTAKWLFKIGVVLYLISLSFIIRLITILIATEI